MTKQEATEKVRELIIKTRANLGISRTQLANRLNTKTTNVSSWENGKVSPSSPVLLMIMEMNADAERSGI